MTTFSEADHPRGESGKFTHKAHEESGVTLPAPAGSAQLDPMTWLPAPKPYGVGWTQTFSHEDEDDGSYATTHRPDPATAAAIRQLLDVPGTAPVRIERTHNADNDGWHGDHDSVELTAGKKELTLEDDHGMGDPERRLMTWLSYRQPPPVAQQAQLLAAAGAGGAVATLRADPLAAKEPKWNGATVTVLGVEDDELLIAPATPRTKARYGRGPLPDRIPLTHIGALDRAHAVERNPSLSWSKGYSSEDVVREVTADVFTKMQQRAALIPVEERTIRTRFFESDLKHGLVPDTTTKDRTGEVAHYGSIDPATFDLHSEQGRWIRQIHMTGTNEIPSRISQLVGRLDHDPTEADVEQIAEALADNDRRTQDYYDAQPGRVARIPRPTRDEYAGYARRTITGYNS
ncbi:hypothetical protein GCM10011374_35580 [Kocuria dechangensis]|uniref:Uncharacterized protein n=1 Tax=Kocuria dechangensis TaxID=1176249 RepID=A0A917LZU5_9MICC|nr:hypothetical protein [Kocuria dechangensis]GGG68147.1 hypothetical protein GCM10011374_35580 [Kocuria dechangensis]